MRLTSYPGSWRSADRGAGRTFGTERTLLRLGRSGRFQSRQGPRGGRSPLERPADRVDIGDQDPPEFKAVASNFGSVRMNVGIMATRLVQTVAVFRRP